MGEVESDELMSFEVTSKGGEGLRRCEWVLKAILDEKHVEDEKEAA